MSQEQEQLWDDFLATWPPDRIEEMSLAEYSAAGNSDTLTGWLEIKTEPLGSIWGGSAFKFGIYHRNDTVSKEPFRGRIWGDEYAWYGKYGENPQAAFEQVRQRLIDIAFAARTGNLDLIDKVDFSEAVKWKVAFLYQDRTTPRILPIYKREMLQTLYRQIDPSAGPKTPVSLMHSGLLDLKQPEEDLLSYYAGLLERLNEMTVSTPQYWAIPLQWLFADSGEIDSFLKKSEITSEDIPEKFNQLLVNAEVQVTDRLALILDKQVRALAEVTNAEPGDYAWTQEARDFLAPLLVFPSDQGKLLSAAEVAEIWGTNVPPLPVPVSAIKEDAKPAPPPKNIILYGPPGTGKTYQTIKRALDLILGSETVGKMSRDTQTKQFRELQRLGRIEFVTFHQNYGYEEFVEGLRPVLSESTDEGVLYEIHDGVFKRVALRAAAAGLPAKVSTGTSFETLWRTFIDQLREEGHRLVKSLSDVDYVIELSSRDNVKAFRCELDKDGEIISQASAGMLASKSNSKLIWDHRDSLGPKPEEVTSDKTQKLFAESRGGGGGHHFTALWPVYKALWELHQEIGSTPEIPEDAEARAQEAIDKPTAGVADFLFTDKTPQYVLVIDEINRGNISKIIGELITLLEPEKRLGQPEELKLPLAYTPAHRFAVPPNLHLIGTMNTADRSIALMDVALRRRFTFEEMMPDAGIVAEGITKASGNAPLGILCAALFEAMNGRIRYLYDRDHQLGHAYFLKVRSLEDLRQLFVDKLVPLLQEYFYGAWDKIGMVLGCPYDESGKPARSGPVVNAGAYVAPMIVAGPLDSGVLSGWESEDYEARLDYAIAPVMMRPGGSEVELLEYFLGVTNFSAEERKHYRDLLTTVSPSDPAADGTGEGAA